jgi:hypothetical protein
MQFNPLHFEDQKGTQLQLGDLVTTTKGTHKGGSFVFVFCIPQHRFGFIYKRIYDNIVEGNAAGDFNCNIVPEPFVIDRPNLDFYYTPKSKKEIVKL